MRRLIILIAMAVILLSQTAKSQRRVEDIDLELVNNCLVFGPNSMAKLLNDAARGKLFDLVVNSTGTLGEVRFLTVPKDNQIQGIVFHDLGSADRWYWSINRHQPSLNVLPVLSSSATERAEQKSLVLGHLPTPIIPGYFECAVRADIRPAKKRDPDAVQVTTRSGKKLWIKFTYIKDGDVRPPQLPLAPNKESDPRRVISQGALPQARPLNLPIFRPRSYFLI